MGGSILNRSSSDVLRILEDMAMNSYQWPSERHVLKKVANVDSPDTVVLAAEVERLKEQFVIMRRSKNEAAMGEPHGESSWCPEDVNYVNQYGERPFQNPYRPNQGGRQIYQGNRGHPNFSYANPNNVIQPPPQFLCHQWGD